MAPAMSDSLIGIRAILPWASFPFAPLRSNVLLKNRIDTLGHAYRAPRGFPVSRAVVRIVLVGFAAAGLATCGTTQPARIPVTYPRPSAPPPAAPVPPRVTANPAYKVGNPYQVAGLWYYPKEQTDYDETGIGSWYGAQFHGMLTGNGEVFDRGAISAAHPTLPMPSNVRVTNLENGRSIVVRVNDRGPFVNGRIIDLSEHAADLLGYRGKGIARVRVTYIGRADLYGPGPAPPSQETPVEIAGAVPAAPTMMVEEANLPPVAGAPVAPPRPMASLPAPVEQMFQVVEPEIPDGEITEVPVPAVTAIYVQAGAFSSLQNAGTVAARLSGEGARVYPAVANGKPIYRVRIGPFQNVEEADAALNRAISLGHNDVQIVVDAGMS